MPRLTVSALFGALLSFAALTHGPLSSSARAQETSAGADDEAARRHFRLGQAHYENGSFADAATEFAEAYRLSRRPQLLYNVFVAYRDAGDLPHAVEALRSYLELVPDAENGAMLRARLEAMERLLAQQTAGQEASPEDTAQATDTSDTGLADEQASIGDETSGEEDGQDVHASSGATGGSPPAASGGGGFGSSVVGWIVGGAGLALVAVGAVTGGLALATQDSIDARCPNRVCPSGEGIEGDRDTGEALSIATDVLLITGAVTLATGVVLLFVLDGGSSSADEAPVALGCGPFGCEAVVRTRF